MLLLIYREDESAGHAKALDGVKYSVFALGNSSYPKFCSFGKLVDTMLEELGAERLYETGLGDELCGQEQSFNEWSPAVFKVIF